MTRKIHRTTPITAAVVAAVLSVLLVVAGQAAKPTTNATGHRAQINAVLAACDR